MNCITVNKYNIRIKVTILKDISKKLKGKADENQHSINNYIYNLIVKDLEKNDFSKSTFKVDLFIYKILKYGCLLSN